MISVFHKNQKLIVAISAVIIMLFILSSVGYMGFSGIKSYVSESPAAKVGNTEISQKLYYTLLNSRVKQMANAGIDTDDAQIKNYIQSLVLSSLVREEAFYQSAQKLGLGVSDYEIGYIIHSMFNMGGVFNKAAYVAYTKENYRMMPEDFEALMKHNQVAAMYSSLIATPFKVTPGEALYSYKTQNKNTKNFEKDKALFLPTVVEAKTEAGQRMYFDHFANTTEIKEYPLD